MTQTKLPPEFPGRFTGPDEEGIKTEIREGIDPELRLNTRPDEEGIKTEIREGTDAKFRLNTRPDEEGIKTFD